VGDDRLDDLQLERYKLGELPKNQMRKLARQIRNDPRIVERLKQLEDSDQLILEEYPPRQMAPLILDRFSRESGGEEGLDLFRKGWRRRLVLAAPVFMALILLVILYPVQESTVQTHEPVHQTNGNRVKGPQMSDLAALPEMLIFRHKNNQVEQLRDGAGAQTGDLVQVAYVAATQRYGVILSIDGRGAVTLHYPDSDTGETLLNKGKQVLLTNAYELDDAPGFERFFFITSQSEIDVQDILHRAHILAKIPKRALIKDIEIPANFQQTSFTIIKGGHK